MTLFKDLLNSDIDTFINSNEFADEVKIDGELVSIVYNDDELKERQISEGEGLHENELLFHVSKQSFPFYPRPETRIDFDGEIYTIKEASEEEGMFTIRIQVVSA